MFKRFKGKEHIKGITQLKSSTQKALKAKIIEIYPDLEPFMSEIFPKKSQLTLIKCEERISLYSLNNEILFFQYFDNIYPHLKLLHKYPDGFLKVQADQGVIKSILSGANLMCPGLTSKGAYCPNNIDAEKTVSIMVYGKEHAVAVGLTKLSSSDIKTINKGIGIENIHYIGDSLWNLVLD
ncbi:hypothetical protein PNEG_02144 [Pneumocystis murina B123]|uniref:Translation machinery-associated protein 20 n=1 Tax=Pneumocystis murina (strain B123) TaxID=1069680 RepID=M7NQL1_PNEMU|nr:hypothetical protein PNEG_02144 [Pneumocystis murina B123]EMR09557.1 hypothetical protein PNEG_02144 [Pneumocystis murina B123]